MNGELITVLALLFAAIVAFLMNKPRMDVVAIIAIIVLPITGVITLDDALNGFSDSSVILVAAFFVIGEGLVRTGVAYQVGDWLVKQAKNNETRLIVFLMLSVAILGSVMSSTGIVAIFIPIVLSIAAKMKADPRRLMMPLSFAGLISGMMTLVATPPNLVVSSQLEQSGLEPFNFFSFTPVGLIILVIGIIYMLFARRILAKKAEKPIDKAKQGRRHLYDFIRDYKLTGRSRRVRVKIGSMMIGSTLGELHLRENHSANIIAIERKQGRFGHNVLDAVPDREIRRDDILLIDFFYPELFEDFCTEWNLEMLPFAGDYFTDQSREIGMAEVIVHPDSAIIGKSLLESEFRSHYRLNVVGVRRDDEALEHELSNEKLKSGDILLVIGTWKAIKQLQTHLQDFVVLSIPAEIEEVAPSSSQAPYALISLLITVALMITGIFPNVLVALFGCLLMGAFSCINMENAYRSIHWQSIILIVGMFPFAVALQKTGGVDLAVEFLLSMVGDFGPRFLLFALFLLTAVIGLFISNTATAILLAPIAIQVANAMEVSPYPFAMTVAVAASAAFMTPVSSPVNTLVVGPGRYSFGDFLKLGVPFTLIVMMVSIFMLPVLFPFHP